MAVSDRTLRRFAWAAWWFLPAMVAVGLPLSIDERHIGELVFLSIVLTFPLTGLLILRLQPRNTIGWLLMSIGLVWSLSFLADNYARYGLLVNPESVPGPEVVAALAASSWVPAIGLMGTFLILLYPDGRLPSSRWRPMAWLSALTILGLTLVIDLSPGPLEDSPVPTLVNPLGLDPARPILDVLLVVFGALFPLCAVACAIGLVGRFRRSRGVERLQLRWLATAGAMVAFAFLVSMVGTILSDRTAYSDGVPAWLGALQTVSILSFILVPIAIGIAVLRHGLYDLDVVINRTLVYGSLTATLAGAYLGSVLLLQLILSPLTDQSDLAVAGSTLAVAALFRPARARIQSIVDRRFYRSRYDAARTLDAFAGRLRSEIDLDAVGTDLRAAVQETVQPAHLSLWIRP